MYGKYIERLIELLSRLPGVGGKSAERIAFYIINSPKENALALSEAILRATENANYCSVCMTISDTDICEICSDSKRDGSTILVVEDSRNLAAFEKTGEYKGVYHVLCGVLSPANKMGPDDIKIKELLERIKTKEIKEVIIATNPNIEGETTALYLAKLIFPFGTEVTRIAQGVPAGSDLEYANNITLARALNGRVKI